MTHPPAGPTTPTPPPGPKYGQTLTMPTPQDPQPPPPMPKPPSGESRVPFVALGLGGALFLAAVGVLWLIGAGS